MLWKCCTQCTSKLPFHTKVSEVKSLSHSLWSHGLQSTRLLCSWAFPGKSTGVGNAKECSNYHKIELISHTSKVMLKILQARLQQYMSWELPDVQAGFRKDRGTRDQIATIHWIIEKVRDFQKNIYSALLTMPKPLTVWITTNCEKFLKRWEYQNTLPASWEICMRVKKQQNQIWENKLVQNWERSTSRLYIATLLI